MHRVGTLPDIDQVICGPAVCNAGVTIYYYYLPCDLQLAICMGHVWVSSGYSFRFMGQESVRDTRILNSTVPKISKYLAEENLDISTVSVVADL